ncbi:hypothetical protein SAMN05444285_1312 [Draconibacterium orientale]|uniref:Uncharacterized protein n=1 Tax=Draconibacterium orientale TaxID=1168034 RepID=A0A1I0IEN2_9BACT|nr:hypothetical protein SAMN05444285_1312 [Draconibacterium orientale]
MQFFLPQSCTEKSRSCTERESSSRSSLSQFAIYQFCNYFYHRVALRSHGVAQRGKVAVAVLCRSCCLLFYNFAISFNLISIFSYHKAGTKFHKEKEKTSSRRTVCNLSVLQLFLPQSCTEKSRSCTERKSSSRSSLSQLSVAVAVCYFTTLQSASILYQSLSIFSYHKAGTELHREKEKTSSRRTVCNLSVLQLFLPQSCTEKSRSCTERKSSSRSSLSQLSVAVAVCYFTTLQSASILYQSLSIFSYHKAGTELHREKEKTSSRRTVCNLTVLQSPSVSPSQCLPSQRPRAHPPNALRLKRKAPLPCSFLSSFVCINNIIHYFGNRLNLI